MDQTKIDKLSFLSN